LSQDNPKLFISYCWSSEEHEQWVLDLATELREAGIDVFLDKWDLKEGQDALKFMEKMVTDPKIKKVAIICDHTYVEKADKRTGGVGTETQIISPEIYAKEDQNKFVVIVAERDENGKACLPTYYKSRIFIDLSESDSYATNFEKLLRWIYDKPLYQKPEIGKIPEFLSETNSIKLGTSVKCKRALDAIRNNKGYANGALDEYFQTFVENLEKFRISNAEGEFDDEVIKNIDNFLPYRNESITIFLTVAQYRNIPETWQQLHKFFENLIPYMYSPERTIARKKTDFDNFRFIIHELFLYAISSLLKYECFDAVAYLIRQHYFVEKNNEYNRNIMKPFTIFFQYMSSLDRRNERLKLGRTSLRADLLKQRSETSGIKFMQLMQSDFILFIRDCLDAIKYQQHQFWWPTTLLYIERHNGTLEIFARAQSKEYFSKINCIFDIGEKKDFILLFEAFKKEELTIPSWGFFSLKPNPEILLGFEKLATRP